MPVKTALKILLTLAISTIIVLAARTYAPAFRAVFDDIAGIAGVSTPGPLIAKFEAARTNLTRAGTIRFTNIARQETSGLPALAEDAKLNTVAEIRLKDMFDNQYFAHESPTGTDAAKGAEIAGYEHVSIGENIALGNFGDDEKLVQAWMDSPGHRANILNTSYTEIGVAVGKGVYEGRTTWIGVQIFGKPASACPAPSAGTKARIDSLNSEIADLKADIDRKRQELEDQPKPRTQEEADAYNRKVDAYNAAVAVLNGLIAEAKKTVEQYNAQVKTFNACVNS